MCLHGAYKYVDIINSNQNKKRVVVDACIADEIQTLNNQGVITIGCCCGHGLAGQIIEWKNGYGNWKGHCDPPNTLIDKNSVEKAKGLGYTPYPYYYADGEQQNVWQMHLKTGCVEMNDCETWHKNRGLRFEERIGIVN